MKFVKHGIIGAIIGLAICFMVVIPVAAAVMMPNEIRLTESELANGQRIVLENFVHGKYDEVATVDGDNQTYVDLKLFGLFKIKRVKVDVLPFEKLIAGGIPIAFSAKTNGAIVLSDAKGLQKGDVITKINGELIQSVDDVSDTINVKNGESLEMQYIRKGKVHTCQVEQTENNLGLWLKDETSGIGMLTYINPDNNNFAALGHKITDHETGAVIDAKAGDVYQCNVVGIAKSDGRKVGELQGAMKKSFGVQGSVLSSNSSGVYGCLDDTSRILQLCNGNVYPVASRYAVRPGKATVLMALDGENIKEYDIEIIKTRYQKNKQDKGMVLRMTDSRVLEKAGGIIHGMSGSPIIQNGKIVGALTHVMVGDSTKGYGIYIDFILP